nr:DUF4296 domain-containing protein [uncultured Flavobacterium sp.]
MKKLVLIFLVLFLAVSCKKELVKEPKGLLDREKMVNIMYDLSVLEAVRYQNPLSVDSMDTNPTKFILRKYKVDSVQFSQSNKYYAANYETYKDMFDEINARLEKQKKVLDSLVKIEDKKAAKKSKTKIDDKEGSKKTQDLKNADASKEKMELR